MESKNNKQDPEEEEEEEEEEAAATVKKTNIPKNLGTGPPITDTLKKSFEKVQVTEDDLIFYKDSKIYPKDLREDFKEFYDKNNIDFIRRATSRQVIHISEEKNPKSFAKIEDVKNFLSQYSNNFKRYDEIYELGKGGESVVLRIEPYVPLEVVAKMPLVGDDAGRNSELFKDLLMEDGLLKMVKHKDYIADVLEEVILYNKDDKKIIGFISVVE